MLFYVDFSIIFTYEFRFEQAYFIVMKQCFFSGIAKFGKGTASKFFCVHKNFLTIGLHYSS